MKVIVAGSKRRASLWVCLHCRTSLWATSRRRPKCPLCQTRMVKATVPEGA